jgi:hypothetical protein
MVGIRQLSKKEVRKNMAQKLPYNGQITNTKVFFGKRYELLGYTNTKEALEEGIKEFKEAFPGKYVYHTTTQTVIPRTSKKPIKLHVSYVRKI